MNNQNTKTDPVWEMIAQEKKKDLFVKRVSRVSWVCTMVMLLVFLVVTLIDLNHMYELYRKGFIPYGKVINSVTPFAVTLGALSLIVAVLSTVGVFLRLRTTSLAEIQQRLANLEELVTSQK